MKTLSRAAVLAVSGLCVAVSAPSLATDVVGVPTASATAMLAAVTAPLLTTDVRTLQAKAPDFSTAASEPPADRAAADAPVTSAARSLADLVAENEDTHADSDEDRCLASSVYYESKGEPLDGQLAVAQTVINRSKSGRFPDSVCGVIRQRGQFSFLHGHDMPVPEQRNTAWQRAVAIARIAREGLWRQIAPAALFFHARHAGGAGGTRVASIGNHVFLR